MKKLCALLALALACVAAGTNTLAAKTEAIDPEGQAQIDFARSQYRKTNYVAVLHYSDIRDAPKWTGDDKPPLSASAANRIAAEYLELHLGGAIDETGFPLRDNFLDPKPAWTQTWMTIRRFINTDLWYYEIKMQPYINQSFHWPQVTVFVTMAGHVAEFREEREGDK